MLGYNPKSNPKEAWEWFTNLCQNPKETQKLLLKDILKNANQSQIAKKYDFNSIDSIQEYQRKVPITSWKDYETASLKMQKGESDLLFNGKPEVFISTSGTTGKPKLIPETKLAIQAKSITDKLRQYFTIFPFIKAHSIKILPLVNSISIGKTESGIPYGTASGITFANIPKQVAKMFVYPKEVLEVSNTYAQEYLIMLFSISKDTTFIVGNNIAKMEKLVYIAKKQSENICRDIREGTICEMLDIEPNLKEKILKNISANPKRADELNAILKEKKEFIPKNYWKNLKIISCWLSGSVGISVAGIKHLFSKDIMYLDYGYGATEGKFNIPRVENCSYGPLSLHAAFYEFSPIDDKDKFLLAHELKTDECYNLYITNFSGLYRYDMKDIIKIESFYYKTPEIVFVSKSGDIGNIQGEKLAGSTISTAVQNILKKRKLTLKHIEAYPNQNPAHYIFYIQTKQKQNLDETILAKEIDIELQKDLGYKHKRRDGLILDPKVCLMPENWLESIYKEKESQGINQTQLKLPIIIDKPLVEKK